MRKSLILFSIIFAGCSSADLPTEGSKPDATPIELPPTVLNVSTVAELRSAIVDAATRTQIVMAPGTYDLGNEGIRIENKNDLEISGAGRGKTIIKLGPAVAIGFNTAGTDSRITLNHFTIQGTLPSTVVTTAIGSDNDRVALNGATFSDLEIRDVGIGISIATPRGGQCSEINITDNLLDNIQDFPLPDGSTSGSGYGIHNVDCWHVKIADNVIRNADRHAIYQALEDGYRGSGVVIQHNLILDAATTPTIDRPYLVALVVARSKDVVVADNVIVGAAHEAMSLENYGPADTIKSPVGNVELINNIIIGARVADLYLTAPGDFIYWGNRSAHLAQAGMSGAMRITREGAGISAGLIEPDGLQGTQRVVSSSPAGLIFLLQGGALRALTTRFAPVTQSNPSGWPRSTMPGNAGAGFQDMAAGDGVVYYLANDRLSEVNPRGWVRRESPMPMPGTVAMGFSGSSLIVLAGGVLRSINPRDWSDRVIGAALGGTINGMAIFGATAYIMADDVITAMPLELPVTATTRIK